MTKNFPPLNAIKVFSFAAKHQSFTKAAADLNITQSAVSRQIALLEDHLGLQLFERKHQSLLLTEAAKKYLKSVNSAFKILQEGSAKIKKENNKEVINVSILASLSNKWLIPKLKNFREKNPEYKINLFIANNHINLDLRDDIDFSIRIAKKNSWKGFVVEQLLKEDLVCVCAANFKIKLPIKSAAELLSHNLLLHSQRPNSWYEFFKYHKIKNPEIEFNDSYQHFFMLIKAAKDGFGISLVPKFLVEEELKNGQLKLAFNQAFKSDYIYYLISQKQKAHLIKMTDFSGWIREEFK
jgi:LysR family glycine cleavage system transcriptional activator